MNQVGFFFPHNYAFVEIVAIHFTMCCEMISDLDGLTVSLSIKWAVHLSQLCTEPFCQQTHLTDGEEEELYRGVSVLRFPLQWTVLEIITVAECLLKRQPSGTECRRKAEQPEETENRVTAGLGHCGCFSAHSPCPALPALPSQVIHSLLLYFPTRKYSCSWN